MKMTVFQRPEAAVWNPFDSINALNRDFTRFFGVPIGAQENVASWAPAVDIVEQKESVVVQAELPGVPREAINVSIEDGVLAISGERKNEKTTDEAGYHRTERFYGRFERRFNLPGGLDAAKVKAAYKDGVLTVTVPKSEVAKPRQIEVVTT